MAGRGGSIKRQHNVSSAIQALHAGEAVIFLYVENPPTNDTANADKKGKWAIHVPQSTEKTYEFYPEKQINDALKKASFSFPNFPAEVKTKFSASESPFYIDVDNFFQPLSTKLLGFRLVGFQLQSSANNNLSVTHVGTIAGMRSEKLTPPMAVTKSAQMRASSTGATLARGGSAAASQPSAAKILAATQAAAAKKAEMDRQRKELEREELARNTRLLEELRKQKAQAEAAEKQQAEAAARLAAAEKAKAATTMRRKTSATAVTPEAPASPESLELITYRLSPVPPSTERAVVSFAALNPLSNSSAEEDEADEAAELEVKEVSQTLTSASRSDATVVDIGFRSEDSRNTHSPVPSESEDDSRKSEYLTVEGGATQSPNVQSDRPWLNTLECQAVAATVVAYMASPEGKQNAKIYKSTSEDYVKEILNAAAWFKFPIKFELGNTDTLPRAGDKNHTFSGFRPRVSTDTTLGIQLTRRQSIQQKGSQPDRLSEIEVTTILGYMKQPSFCERHGGKLAFALIVTLLAGWAAYNTYQTRQLHSKQANMQGDLDTNKQALADNKNEIAAVEQAVQQVNQAQVANEVANQKAFATIQTQFAAEDSKIAANSAAITSLQVSMDSLTNALNALTTTVGTNTAAITTLQNNVATLQTLLTTLQSTEATDASNISALQTAMTAAQTAITANANAIAAEVTRAHAAEQTNSDAISAEATRAQAAEALNAAAIATEEAARQLAISNLAQQLTGLTNQLNTAVSTIQTNLDRANDTLTHEITAQGVDINNRIDQLNLQLTNNYMSLNSQLNALSITVQYFNPQTPTELHSDPLIGDHVSLSFNGQTTKIALPWITALTDLNNSNYFVLIETIAKAVQQVVIGAGSALNQPVSTTTITTATTADPDVTTEETTSTTEKPLQTANTIQPARDSSPDYLLSSGENGVTIHYTNSNSDTLILKIVLTGSVNNPNTKSALIALGFTEVSEGVYCLQSADVAELQAALENAAFFFDTSAAGVTVSLYNQAVSDVTPLDSLSFSFYPARRRALEEKLSFKELGQSDRGHAALIVDNSGTFWLKVEGSIISVPNDVEFTDDGQLVFSINGQEVWVPVTVDQRRDLVNQINGRSDVSSANISVSAGVPTSEGYPKLVANATAQIGDSGSAPGASASGGWTTGQVAAVAAGVTAVVAAVAATLPWLNHWLGKKEQDPSKAPRNSV